MTARLFPVHFAISDECNSKTRNLSRIVKDISLCTIFIQTHTISTPSALWQSDCDYRTNVFRIRSLAVFLM